MIRTTTLLAVTAIAILGLAVAPGAVAADGELSVEVEQAEDGSAAVTVTHNDAAAANASVAVTPTDENATYDGAGEYVTGGNGTVGLPAPNETVEVAIDATVDNHSASTVATLKVPTDENATDEEDDTAENGPASVPFGQLVSQFVSDVDANESEGGIGNAVATFVLDNNPASDAIPDHAGPPDDGERGPGGDDRGNASAPGNATDRGNGGDQDPPDHAGPGGDDDDRGGPPSYAGPGGNDAAADDEETDEDDAEETEDETEE